MVKFSSFHPDKGFFNCSSTSLFDPIIGTTLKPMEGVSMTDVEKDREAEKLFVLFGRLGKGGVNPPEQNPMRKLIQQRRN